MDHFWSGFNRILQVSAGSTHFQVVLYNNSLQKWDFTPFHVVFTLVKQFFFFGRDFYSLVFREHVRVDMDIAEGLAQGRQRCRALVNPVGSTHREVQEDDIQSAPSKREL